MLAARRVGDRLPRTLVLVQGAQTPIPSGRVGKFGWGIGARRFGPVAAPGACPPAGCRTLPSTLLSLPDPRQEPGTGWPADDSHNRWLSYSYGCRGGRGCRAI
jgi:hypothetical protein